MKKIFNITEVKGLSGPKACICSIQEVGSDITEFEELLNFNFNKYKSTVNEIYRRLDSMAQTTGIQATFFDFKASPDIYALKETDNLRVFCTLKQGKLIILGGGGSKFSAEYGADPNLTESFEEIKQISKTLDALSKTKTLNKDSLESFSFEVEV